VPTGSGQAEAELEDQTLGQARVDGPELSDRTTALLRRQVAQIGHGQVQTTAIQIQIHSGSSTAGSQRRRRRPASGGGQISSLPWQPCVRSAEAVGPQPVCYEV